MLEVSGDRKEGLHLHKVRLKFPQSDGHTEKLEIKEERLGGVQWKTRKREGPLIRNSRKE